MNPLSSTSGAVVVRESLPATRDADEPLAWMDGAFVPRSQLRLPVGDAGFVLGAAVTEQLRTFQGRLFLPAAHEERLRESLAIVGTAPALPLADVFAAAADVAAHNHALQPAADDLALVIFVTPGDLPAQHDGHAGAPRSIIHTFPLAFCGWADAYEAGVSLRVAAVRQVPEACWPVRAKVRSRLHYHLADREVQVVEPAARAVLLHLDGRVSETSTANVAIVRDDAILTPPSADALPGVSLRHVHDLARTLGLGWEARSLTAADLAAADEILLTSTPSCILPATRFDGRPVGSGTPGRVYRRLLSAWSDRVGLDIAAQARRYRIRA